MRVLVVEDEPRLADAIAEWLRDESHAVDVASRRIGRPRTPDGQ